MKFNIKRRLCIILCFMLLCPGLSGCRQVRFVTGEKMGSNELFRVEGLTCDMSESKVYLMTLADINIRTLQRKSEEEKLSSETSEIP